MKFFHREPDIQCWNCSKLISHKDVKWKPRQLPVENIMNEAKCPSEDIELVKKELEKLYGKPIPAEPNKIFGGIEYEYQGQCSECKAELRLFWFGEESVKRNKNKVVAQTLLTCSYCKTPYWRIMRVWYSVIIQKDDEKKEYLVNICPKCKSQLAYPYEYDLERGIIE